MGIGERQPEVTNQAEEKGPLNPSGNKDLERGTCDQEQQKPGIWQKVWSVRIHLLPVLVGAVAAIFLVIVLFVLGGRETPQREVVKDLLVQCPDVWIQYREKCYYYSDKYDTWNNGQKFCESHNSSLAVIDNEKELNLLSRLKDDDNFWIGLSRTANDSGWVWINGTPYTENLFKITRVPINNRGDAERAYLNHNGVKSGSENIDKKWFCSKSVPSYSS